MKGFLLDLHCHTREHSPDADIPALEVIAELRRLGFSGVAFTDHNYVWPAEELRELAKSAGEGVFVGGGPGESKTGAREMKLAGEANFVLFPGQEVRTYSNGMLRGDLLAYGLNESISNGISPEELFRRVKAAGGFLIAPHPAVPGIGLGEHLNSIPLAAVETWNGRYGARIARPSLELASRHGLPAAGNSDAHQSRDIGGGGTLFDEFPQSLDDLHRLLREGRCQPWRPSWIKRALGA